MIKSLKIKEVKALLPRRDENSHKGMNGKVMIIGGSAEYFGAPVLSGLGALHSGADLVYVFVPENNLIPARSLYPDLIVRKFKGDHLTMESVDDLISFSQECDSVLIGPGLGDREETQDAVQKLVKKLSVPTILDADAIQVIKKIKEFPLQQKLVVTPHHAEFDHLIGKDIKMSGTHDGKVVLIRTLATDLGISILLKGPQDLIASELGEVCINETGNAGMTVGGSGDVLSGFIASLIAQGCETYAACQVATYTLGKAGENIYKNKGYYYTATDLALEIPYTLKSIAS